MIGIDDVFDARMASRVGRRPCRGGEHLDLHVLVLDDRLDDELAVGEIAEVGGERAAARRPRPARPRSASPTRTPRSSDVASWPRPRSAAPASISRTITSRPARAQTSAMPEPIRPHPTTPMRSRCGGGQGGGGFGHGRHLVRCTGRVSHACPTRGGRPPSGRGSCRGRTRAADVVGASPSDASKRSIGRRPPSTCG